jgi:hypothetical protein
MQFDNDFVIYIDRSGHIVATTRYSHTYVQSHVGLLLGYKTMPAYNCSYSSCRRFLPQTPWSSSELR